MSNIDAFKYPNVMFKCTNKRTNFDTKLRNYIEAADLLRCGLGDIFANPVSATYNIQQRTLSVQNLNTIVWIACLGRNIETPDPNGMRIHTIKTINYYIGGAYSNVVFMRADQLYEQTAVYLGVVGPNFVDMLNEIIDKSAHNKYLRKIGTRIPDLFKIPGSCLDSVSTYDKIVAQSRSIIKDLIQYINKLDNFACVFANNRSIGF